MIELMELTNSLLPFLWNFSWIYSRWICPGRYLIVCKHNVAIHQLPWTRPFDCVHYICGISWYYPRERVMVSLKDTSAIVCKSDMTLNYNLGNIGENLTFLVLWKDVKFRSSVNDLGGIQLCFPPWISNIKARLSICCFYHTSFRKTWTLK